MRPVRITIAGLSLALVAAIVTAAVLGATRSAAFSKQAGALELRWALETSEGVPASQFAPLRATLIASQYEGARWWSPIWWTQTGTSLVGDLSASTDRIWTAEMGSARQQGRQAEHAWQQLMLQLGQYVPASAVAAAKDWPAELRAASTPASVIKLAAAWRQAVDAAHHEALGAELTAEVAAVGGIQALLSQADAASQLAQADNLDDQQIGALTAGVRSQIANGADATPTVRQLLTALGVFHQLLALNNNVSAGLRPLQLSVDQAGAENTPNSQSFLTQYGAAQSALYAARNSSQLSAVAQQLSALQNSITAELTNDQCGHSVPSGRSITISLTLQEAIFYQDGCVAQATPITTGREFLRTPTGTYHVFFKQSPFTFISPWPKTSSFWYPPSPVSWVMEFASGGYFLHDAPWEPSGVYGPDSEDSAYASHGCIHIPTSVMQWAYQWTPMGAPVVITG